jgi:undecaprenyl phosphate N,N'-diacetylbacillosamine 1-phosphate transferase
VSRRPQTPYTYGKRALDLVAALLLLVIASPFLAIVLAALAVANRSNPFFLQQRIGLDEKVFRVVKLKTMDDSRGADGALLSDAERLTPVGRIVRKTSLDEIPQLFNIVRGQMSFIGPRPLLVRYLPYYREHERVRHSVRPGITGLAQINGRNDLGWDARLAYDVEYVENFSAAQDVRILLATITTVATGSGVKVDVLSGEMRDLDVERSH